VGLVFFAMEAAGIGFFAAAWAASVIWTARDANRRCGHISLRIGAPLTATLLPFAGAAIYALVKPCEERADLRARRLRTRVLESTLAGTDELCPECARSLEPEFRCCPACGERVRSTCGGCGQPVRTAWTACPWCTKPLVESDGVALSEVA
jgi:double zinc ribbon protein